MSPYRSFWSITLGSVEALYVDDMLGNFQPDKEADFVALDWTAGPLAQRWHQELALNDGNLKTKEQAANLLFGIMMVADDRAVDETWVMGRQLYKRK